MSDRQGFSSSALLESFTPDIGIFRVIVNSGHLNRSHLDVHVFSLGFTVPAITVQSHKYISQ
jgi:hypothetical protein